MWATYLQFYTAEKMRQTLDDFVGQQHILGKGKLLRRLIEAKRVPSVIFYGPPGTGKTTLAGIIAESAGARFEKLNAVSSGVADVKVIIDEARRHFEMYGKRTYLLLDECHRWSKTQSDSLLGVLEEVFGIKKRGERLYFEPKFAPKCLKYPHRL